MALEGSIRDFGLPDIIQFLRQQNKSGVLTIRASAHWSKLLFAEGKIVFAVAEKNQGPEGLARLLVEAERVNPSKMEEILKAKPGFPDLERAVVSSGAMTAEELRGFVGLQSREVIFRLFRLEEGRYSFESDGKMEKPAAADPMEADFILLEGMRQFDEWPQVRKKIPENNIIFDKIPEVREKIQVSLDEDGVLDESSAPSEGGISVSQGQMTVFQFVDGLRDADKIAALCGLGEFETVKALSVLLGKEAIRQKGIRQGAATAVPAETPETESGPAETLRAPRFTLGASLWINAACLIFLAAWAVLMGGRIQRGFQGAADFEKVLSSELFAASMNGIRQAEEVFYLQHLRAPDSAGELLEQNPAVARLLLDVRKQGARYPLE